MALKTAEMEFFAYHRARRLVLGFEIWLDSSSLVTKGLPMSAR